MVCSYELPTEKRRRFIVYPKVTQKSHFCVEEEAMARVPFSLFTKRLKSGNFWYARYFNPETNTYDITKSTGVKCVGKKGRKIEAYEWARSHIPSREPESRKFLEYLNSFWADDSEYQRMKRVVEKKPLSNYYITLSRRGIELYVNPYPKFKKVRLKDLKPGLMDDWKLWAMENGCGVRRVNAILTSIRTAINFAVLRGDIDRDPFSAVKKVPYKPKEKGILGFKEVKKIIAKGDRDQRVYLAVILGMLAGMRRGEVRGLQWGDIDLKTGIIDIRHNYVDAEGLKGCKWDSNRKVPIHPALANAIEAVHAVSPHTKPKDYVLFNLLVDGAPCSPDLLRIGINRVLKNIGIDTKERRKRNITFHSLRHTFVTLARVSGLPDITVQALAGHRTSIMMEHYSHGEQVLDFKKVIDKMKDAI